MTGHEKALITLALAEADDPEREARRAEMGEPYRTLLGHFRHEIGHFYWDLLVRDEGQLDAAAQCSATIATTTARRSSATTPKGPPADWQEQLRQRLRDHHPGRISRRPGRTTCTSSTASRPPPRSGSRCIRDQRGRPLLHAETKVDPYQAGASIASGTCGCR